VQGENCNEDRITGLRHRRRRRAGYFKVPAGAGGQVCPRAPGPPGAGGAGRDGRERHPRGPRGGHRGGGSGRAEPLL